jgi:hypothetical protein
MKTLNKIFLTIAGTLFLFAACEDSIPERESSPFTPENCQGVFFPTTNVSTVEMEPTEPTEITFTIARTDSVDAIEVPITVENNTNDVFVVPEKVTFAAGTKETTFKVTFPTAAEGIAYNLKLSVVGDEYVNQYAETRSYLTTNVTRIKWNSIEPFIYIDGTFLTFYGVGQFPMYVSTEKAEVGTAVRYRFKNAYGVATPGSWINDEYIPTPDADGIYNGYPYNWPGDVDEENDYYTVIEIDRDGNVSMTPCDLGVIWSYGMFSIGSIYGNLSTATDISLYPLGSVEEGDDGEVITFPANSLYISMANYQNGGKYPCGTPTVIYTTKNAYLAANMKIENFNEIEYEEIPGAVSEFESAAYSENWSQSIAKAIDIDNTNEESEYKDLYYLADLYAKDYGLAFYYNGKLVSIPAKQEIGKQAFGKAIYVSPSNDIESSVATNNKGVTIYTLGLKFHFEDGTVLGEFAETFFYSEDPVSYSIADFYGNYHLTASSQFDGTPYEMNVHIAAGGSANTFLITGIDEAPSGIIGTFDPSTSALLIAPQTLLDKATYQGNEYELTLYTTTLGGDISDELPMEFTFNMSGNLVLSNTSEADGYLLDLGGLGWWDGYYGLTFTPISTQAVVKKAAAVKATRVPASKILNRASVTKAPKCAKGNFAVQAKGSAKKTLKRSLGSNPIF